MTDYKESVRQNNNVGNLLKKDMELIEDVQKLALKVCLKSWNTKYNELLVQSNLPSIRAIEDNKQSFATSIR